MTYLIAADTGGTFTDLAAYDSETGRVVYAKSLTTYGDLLDGMMDCVQKSGVDLARADSVKFGTTLVINTYVQRNGARTALVTTKGFRDVLEIRRGNRPVPFDLRYERDPVLIERELRFGVDERLAPNGAELRPLDRAELDRVADQLRDLKVQAIAVSFINAFADDTHEREAVELLRERLPGVYVSAGSELSREWYEYERTSTVAANAYVGPKIQDYVRRLNSRLAHEGFTKNFSLMASNGGVFSAQRAQERPVMLVESGPVGGCIGAGFYAEQLGLPKVIAFDMGGTTAKCAVVENGRFEVKSPYYVGGYERGFPVRGGVLDIVEVGAGGGSIAWLDKQGGLHVGPRSAGSTPGPACYGRGGVEPTMTDANLLLGRIAANSFLGGEMALDEPAAERAMTALADRLGFQGREGRTETAQGILSLGSVVMASAIKRITIERGLDPRDFCMIAFGGGGPLHTAALARELGIPHLIIPPEPGNFSALGMILADARIDDTRTFLEPLAPDTMEAAALAFAAMRESIAASMARDLGEANIVFEQQADLSFRGQRHSIRVPLGARLEADPIRRLFEESYQRRYGHVEPNSPIQFVNLILSATARTNRPNLTALRPQPTGRPSRSNATTRSVYFAVGGGWLSTPVLQRANLAIGTQGSGPAVIEEYGSTTIIGPEDAFTVGDLGEIHVRWR